MDLYNYLVEKHDMDQLYVQLPLIVFALICFIIFEVLEKTFRQVQVHLAVTLSSAAFAASGLIFQRIIFRIILLFLFNNKLFFKSFPVILD